MKTIGKVIGRLLALLVNKNIITQEEATWVLEPAKEAMESEAKPND